jgi:hypothetical protein
MRRPHGPLAATFAAAVLAASIGTTVGPVPGASPAAATNGPADEGIDDTARHIAGHGAVQAAGDANIDDAALRAEVAAALASGRGRPTVTVEIVAGSGGAPAAIAAVGAAGGAVRAAAPGGVVLADVPASQVAVIDEATAGYVRAPLMVDARPAGERPAGERPAGERPMQFGPTTGGAASTVGAAAWHAAGLRGGGVKVGIVDFFDVSLYWNTAEMGPNPVAAGHARCIRLGADCSAEYSDNFDEGGDDHGPAVAEIVKDLAPDAELYIGTAGTVTDYYALIDWFAANGVQVVNRSLGAVYDGPGDGRGAFAAMVDYAAAKGITWVNAAGNTGNGAYYRGPSAIDVGRMVHFAPTGSTWLPILGCTSLAGVRWANDWDLPPSQRTNYRALLYEAPANVSASNATLVEVADAPQQQGAPPIENFRFAYCPSPDRMFFLRIELMSGSPAGDTLEVLDYVGDIPAPYWQAPGSASLPVVDSRNRAVLSVGAVDPPTSGQLGPYSAQGPTNDGRVKPDLTAPAGFASTTFAGAFSGTSASSPVVAGVAAVLLGAGLATSAEELADLVRHLTVDRGSVGPDNVYGAGELRLPTAPTGAIASTPSSYVPLPAPARILDTRPTSPIGPASSPAALAPGAIVDVGVAGAAGVPSAAIAIAVNVTIVDATRPDYVQVLPTLTAAIGGHSNLNLDAAAITRPNFAIVPLSATGSISVYNRAGGHILVDLLGYFVPSAAPATAGRLVAVPPQRVLDTRQPGATGPLADGATVSIGRAPAGVPAGEVAALVVNVTATVVGGPGYVQAYPADVPASIGRTSTLNIRRSVDTSNTVIVPVGGSGAALYVSLPAGGTTHLVADITGYITSSAAAASTAGQFVPVRPGRVYDSRASSPLADDESRAIAVIGASGPAPVVPTGATAVAANLTVTSSQRPGYLQAWAATAGRPATSNLNWSGPGATLANAAVIGVGADGGVMLRATDDLPQTDGPIGHFIADVFGYFAS